MISVNSRNVVLVSRPWLLTAGIILILLCLLGVRQTQAEEKSDTGDHWGYWRGPASSGAAPSGSKPPVEWSAEKNVKWKAAIPGEGSGTVVVWGEKVFVQTAVKAGQAGQGKIVSGGDPSLVAQAGSDGNPPRRPGGGETGGDGGTPSDAHRFILMCLDRNSGDVIWQKVAVQEVPHEGHHQTHAFGSHSPVTNGREVIGFFGSRGIFCYDFEGNLKWQRDLGEMSMRNGFGEGNSAAIHGDTLVVPWDHEGASALYALDVNSGETLWEAARDEPSNWGSPLIVEHQGKAQVVVTGENEVRAYDLITGDELWWCGGQTSRPVASPVTDGKNVYVGSGFRGSYFAGIRLGGKGGLVGSDSILWEIDRNTPDISSPLLSGKRLYFLSAKSGIVTCVDAPTGKVLWGPERIPGLGDVYSSPVAANGNVYLVGREGTTVVFKDADTFEVVATNQLDDAIDGSPVVVGNEILLRGKHFLYSIAEP